MTYIINCGEVEIEDGGIAISLGVMEGANKVTPEDLFINFIDNLLGISEFIADCGYDYADVSIDFRLEGKESTGYLCFERFLNNPENSELKRLFTKYCSYIYQEPLIEEEIIWYNFTLDNIKAEMSEEDSVDFCKIFKERLK